MRKLKLEIDGLRVESFDTAAAGREAGTVRAHVTAYYELCYPGQTGPQDTCGPTDATCEPTCNEATCYNCGGTGGTGGTGGGTTGRTACGAQTCAGYASCDPALLCYDSFDPRC